MRKVSVVFGTRPESIKLAPVIRELNRSPILRANVIVSSQHTDLLRPFLRGFGIEVDHDLEVMREGQSPNDVLARVLETLAPVLRDERPDVVLVQGDTTTALAGAISAFHAGIPVGHVEAGLRTGNPLIPFPEEMNRRLISRIAAYHFAATDRNAAHLVAEGIDPTMVFLTGNPVVDALRWILAHRAPSDALRALTERHRGKRIIVLTTHRRESFGPAMRGNLEVLAAFVSAHAEAVVVFPMHPNPNVRAAACAVLDGVDRVEMIEPLDYADFVYLLSVCWLIVSDSGGVQEEAPSLGRRVIVLRRNTERPEAVDAGYARLVGDDPALLERTLEAAWTGDGWVDVPVAERDLYGAGDAARRIRTVLETVLRGVPVSGRS
jgi:UDP-N-acetylglucosamine 2-epimerase (non-hydrolysing)